MLKMMDMLEEGEGESSSPPRVSQQQGSGFLDSVGIRDEIYARLIEIKCQDAINDPDFRYGLQAHLSRFGLSYATDVMSSDRAEDVVIHKKLLAEAKDSNRRPSFHVRLLKHEDHMDERKEAENIDDENPLDGSSRRGGVSFSAVYEVTFSTKDRPKLLSQLSALLSDVGLNIQEAHVFSTNDGFSLDVFVVDGWVTENEMSTDSLCKEIQLAIDKSEKSLSGPSSFAFGRELKIQSNLGDSEIDNNLLEKKEKIGSGSCGDLYRGFYLGQEVAIKYLKFEHLAHAVEAEFTQEVDILRSYQDDTVLKSVSRHVHHGNVVRFIGACTKPHLCLVTEYMAGGSVYDFLNTRQIGLELPVLLKIAIDVCKGMDYLHQKSIIHRDLKTANLLMDSHGVVKVADFGVARFQTHGGIMTAETGTYRWMAPEVINHQHYNEKVDVFSFAIVLWELATSKVPYETMSPVQAAIGVRQGLRPEIPKNTHPRLIDLMQRCWEANPSRRPPFSELTTELEHLLQQIQLGNDKCQQVNRRNTKQQKRQK